MELTKTNKNICDYCENVAVATIDGENCCEDHCSYCNTDKKLYNFEDIEACGWCNYTHHKNYLDEDGICEDCRPSYDENEQASHPSLTAEERN